MKVKSESEVAQSCPTLHDPVDCSPPGFSIYEIFRARVLEWGTIAFSQEVPVVSFKIKKEFSNFIPFQDCFSYLGSLPISYRSFLIGQLLKNPPAMWKTWVRSLGWEDSLEKEMATHSSTPALKVPWTEELGAGYCPWGCKESGTTERLHFHFHANLSCSLRYIPIGGSATHTADRT